VFDRREEPVNRGDGMRRVRGVLVTGMCLLATCSCARKGWYRCHYRAVARTPNAAVAPCVAELFDRERQDPGPILSEPAEAPGPFHGWLQVVRPQAAETLKVRLVLRCQGYDAVSREFEWHPTPDTCKPGVEVGELTLTPVSGGKQ